MVASHPRTLGPHHAGLPLEKEENAATYLSQKSHADLPTESPAPSSFRQSLGSNQVSTASSPEAAYANLIT